MKNKFLTIVKYLFLIVIVIIILRLLKDEWPGFIRQLKKMTWLSIIGLLLCSMIYNVVEGISYYYMGKKCGSDMSVLDGILCSYYCSFFRIITVGTGTAAAGIFYLNGKRVEPSKSFGMITINYMLQKVGIAVLCAICFIIEFTDMKLLYSNYFGYLVLGIFATIATAVGLLAVILWGKLHGILVFLGNKFARREKIKQFVNSLEHKLTKVRNESKDTIRDRKFMSKLFWCNFLKFIGWNLIPCVILVHEIGSVSVFALVFTIAALAEGLAGVIPSPGAAGTTEALFYTMFLVVATKEESIAIMILYRMFTYVVPGLMGGGYVLVKKIKALSY